MNTTIRRCSKLYSLQQQVNSTITSSCRCLLSCSISGRGGGRIPNHLSLAAVTAGAAPHQSISYTIMPTQSRLFHSSNSYRDNKDTTVKVTFIDPMGVEKTVDAQIGKNLLQVAHDHNIELEGACGGGTLSKKNDWQFVDD
jgi:Ferredoxin